MTDLAGVIRARWRYLEDVPIVGRLDVIRLREQAFNDIAVLLDALHSAQTERDEAIDRTAELWTEREQARAELQRLHSDTQQAFAAIAVRQKRDAARIADLEARSGAA